MIFLDILNISIFRLSDTGADPELRRSAIQSADVVLLCFPVNELKEDNQEDLKNTLKVFTEEVARSSSGKQPCMILVGTKNDLKEEKKRAEQCWELAKALDAQEYLESSAVLNNNEVRELFQQVVKIRGAHEIKGKQQTASSRNHCHILLYFRC